MISKQVKFLFQKNLNQALIQFLVSLGAIWLLIEFISFFKEDWIKKDYRLFLGAIGASIIWGIYKAFPLVMIVRKSNLSHVTIEVRIDDLFDLKNCNVSIPVADCFDTQFPDVISEKTVEAVVIKREFNGDQTLLDNRIKEYLEKNQINGHSDPEKKSGKQIRFPFGTTAIVTSNYRKLYLTTMAEQTNEGFVKGTKESIWIGLCGLWDTYRKTGHLEPIGIPLWGGGQSRTKLSKLGLAQLIILSFVLATNESKLSNKLILTFQKQDYDPFMFAELKRFIGTLEF